MMKTINPMLLTSLTCLGAVNAEVGDLTGTATLELNSHFVSYGLDVWGAGGSATRGLTLNPSLSFKYQVGENTSINAGGWLDINDNNTMRLESRETDVWIGVSHTIDKFTGSLTYQNWQYGGNSEEILDFGLSYDTFLSPTLTVHQRLGNSNIRNGRDAGTVIDLGLGHSFDLTDKSSLSFSSNIGYALTKIHTANDGYAYTSIGAKYSYQLNDATSVYGGLKYYFTNEDVVSTSGKENFLTYSVGISYSF